MKAKIIALISATLALTMTACGTISPPAQTRTETTTITTATSESISLTLQNQLVIMVLPLN